jgi:F-type H+-transporting ATPase subunit gamma
MVSLRDIRHRIRSVESTQQITKAMKMVAASKLKKTETLLNAFRPYAESYADVVGRLTLQLKELRHPLLAASTQPILTGRVGLVFITADRGLCGGFNTSLHHRYSHFVRKHSEAEIVTVCIGRKGRDFLRKKGISPAREYVNVLGDVDFDMAVQMVRHLLLIHQEKRLDSIQLLYSRFRSAISQQIVLEQLAPLKPPEQESQSPSPSYLFEPDPEGALEAVLEQSLAIHLYRAMLESMTSEYGARMTAMDNATENAGEMIEKLTLSLNRARQAVITKEISEIMGGAEALKA